MGCVAIKKKHFKIVRTKSSFFIVDRQKPSGTDIKEKTSSCDAIDCFNNNNGYGCFRQYCEHGWSFIYNRHKALNKYLNSKEKGKIGFASVLPMYNNKFSTPNLVCARVNTLPIGKKDALIIGTNSQDILDTCKAALFLVKKKEKIELPLLVAIDFMGRDVKKNEKNYGLSIFMAIWSAVTNTRLYRNQMFTGDIDINGNIIHGCTLTDKTTLESMMGAKCIVLPRSRIKVTISSDSLESLVIVSTIDEMIKKLEENYWV